MTLKDLGGRKFLLAIFAGLVGILSIILFTHYIKDPNAGLLLTVIGAPCIGIIGIVAGTQGAHDIRHGEGYMAPINTDDKQ